MEIYTLVIFFILFASVLNSSISSPKVSVITVGILHKLFQEMFEGML